MQEAAKKRSIDSKSYQIDLEIPKDPNNFPFENLRTTIGQIVYLIQSGKSPDEIYCRCSRFNLIERVRNGLNGTLFGGRHDYREGYETDPSLDFTDRMTYAIYGEIVRAWQRKNFN